MSTNPKRKGEEAAADNAFGFESGGDKGDIDKLHTYRELLRPCFQLVLRKSLSWMLQSYEGGVRGTFV